MLTFNILILIFCLKAFSVCPFFLKYLFKELSEVLHIQILIVYILLYIISIVNAITGFIGIIITFTYSSIIALKIYMTLNYLNTIKDIISFVIIIAILLNQRYIALILFFSYSSFL